MQYRLREAPREDLSYQFLELPLELSGKAEASSVRPAKPSPWSNPAIVSYFDAYTPTAFSCPAAKAPVAACSMR